MKQCSRGHWVPWLCAITLCSAGFADKVVGVVVGGRPLESGPAARITNAVLYAPLGACAKLAGATVRWDNEKGRLEIVSARGLTIVALCGSDELKVGAETLHLPKPVQRLEKTAFGPVELLLEMLGCRVHWDEKTDFVLANGVLEQVVVRADKDSARIEISSTIPVTGTMGDLNDPPRRFVDLKGLELAPDLDCTRSIYSGPLMKVRIGMPAAHPPMCRVVADLADEADVRWEPAANGCGGAMVIGKPDGSEPVVKRHVPTVTEVTTIQSADGVERFRATVDWPVIPTWDLQIRPPRITLTLPDVEWNLKETELPMSGEFVDRVEVQPSEAPPGTTLTLLLNELIRFDVKRLDGGGVEVVFQRGKLRDQKIVIDPGHGGRDNGASGQVLREKDVNLDVARRATQLLRTCGADARMTRSEDGFVDLFRRAEMANEAGADLFVSVHCNAMPRRNQGFGTETFYYTPPSKGLGYIMQNCLVTALRRADRGLKRARFVVIRETRMPAVLVELAFLNHDEEEALLQQDQSRQRAAMAITEGLRQFVEGTGSQAPGVERGAGLTRTVPATRKP